MISKLALYRHICKIQWSAMLKNFAHIAVFYKKFWKAIWCHGTWSTLVKVAFTSPTDLWVPTNSILIKFEIPSKFGELWFKLCSNNHNEILHISQQLHCHDICKMSVICWICYEQEYYKISSNFEFNWNILSGMGAMSLGSTFETVLYWAVSLTVSRNAWPCLTSVQKGPKTQHFISFPVS